MSDDAQHPKPADDAAVPLDEDQLDQVSGGAARSACVTHGTDWPCPILVNGAPCPGPKYTMGGYL